MRADLERGLTTKRALGLTPPLDALAEAPTPRKRAASMKREEERARQ